MWNEDWSLSLSSGKRVPLGKVNLLVMALHRGRYLFQVLKGKMARKQLR